MTNHPPSPDVSKILPISLLKRGWINLTSAFNNTFTEIALLDLSFVLGPRTLKTPIFRDSGGFILPSH